MTLVGVVALIAIGGLVSIAAGPVGFAVVVMIAVPFALLALLRSAGHTSTDNPHFAAPHKP